MKKYLLIAGLGALLFASCSPTNVVNSWKDPNTKIKNPSVHKIVVAALIYDQSVRRRVEDYMVSLYKGQATQSYLVLGNDSLLANEDIYTSRLRNEGYDGIVVMKQTGENTTHQYIPGQPSAFYATWGGYWRSGWRGSWFYPGTPGYVATNRTWNVEVSVYSLITNKLVWAGSTSTTNPGGRVPLFEDVCKAVKKKMKADGFIS